MFTKTSWNRLQNFLQEYSETMPELLFLDKKPLGNVEACATEEKLRAESFVQYCRVLKNLLLLR